MCRIRGCIQKIHNVSPLKFPCSSDPATLEIIGWKQHKACTNFHCKQKLTPSSQLSFGFCIITVHAAGEISNFRDLKNTTTVHIRISPCVVFFVIQHVTARSYYGLWLCLCGPKIKITLFLPSLSGALFHGSRSTVLIRLLER